MMIPPCNVLFPLQLKCQKQYSDAMSCQNTITLSCQNCYDKITHKSSNTGTLREQLFFNVVVFKLSPKRNSRKLILCGKRF